MDVNGASPPRRRSVMLVNGRVIFKVISRCVGWRRLRRRYITDQFCIMSYAFCGNYIQKNYK